MTNLKVIALALALAPATAFAGDDPGFAFTGGYGTLDGGGNPLAGLPFEMPSPLSEIDHEGSDDVWTVSASWFINKHWAIEAWTAPRASQSVEIEPDIGPYGSLASYSTSPVTLMAQYHFGGMGRITPFVGAGWHWTTVSSAPRSTTPYEIARSTDSGFAAMAGLDFAISKGWFARGDVRWMDGSTDVTSREGVTKSVNTDRVFYGVSLGYRF